jgi:hypothetical protein
VFQEEFFYVRLKRKLLWMWNSQKPKMQY